MNLFIIQKDTGAKDLWYDFSSAANIEKNDSLVPKALNASHNINFYETVKTKFVIQNSAEDNKQFVLKRPQDVANMATMNFHIDEIINAFDETSNWAKFVLFASPLTNNSTQESVSKNASFFIRTENGQIKNSRSGVVHDDSVLLIPWFVVFKLEHVPVYYIVLNNKTVDITTINENSEDTKIFVTDYHLGNFGGLIFNPSFSRNVKVVNENHLFVQGDTFTINPLDNWFINNHAKEIFDITKIKCTSNFDYTTDENGIHFNLTESDGYIIIRWPHGTSFFHGIYLKNKNSLQKEFIVKRIKS